jgi:hypothetical protein
MEGMLPASGTCGSNWPAGKRPRRDSHGPARHGTALHGMFQHRLSIAQNGMQLHMYLCRKAEILNPSGKALPPAPVLPPESRSAGVSGRA